MLPRRSNSYSRICHQFWIVLANGICVRSGRSTSGQSRTSSPRNMPSAGTRKYFLTSRDTPMHKRRLAGDTVRAATSDEVKDLRREAQALKEVVADLTLENRLLKKSMIADGADEA